MNDVLIKYKELLIQKRKIRMIKEKYIPLLLSHQIREITTIGDTHTLWVIVEFKD